MHDKNQDQTLDLSSGSSSQSVDVNRLAANHITGVETTNTTTQLETVSSSSEARIHEVDTPVVVQLREEELGANKQWIETGAVLVRKEIETSTETLPVQVGYEEVHVDRVPVNRVMRDDEKVEPRQEGDTWIIPVVEEELVVMKRRVVREELRITKQLRTREEQVSGEVKKERLNIETTGSLESSK